MELVSKENFLEYEELLYIPKLHCMYLLKPVFCALLIFLCFAGIKLLELRFSLLLIPLLIFAGFSLMVFSCRAWHYMHDEYGITNKRLLLKRSCFNTITKEMSCGRIESIYIKQGLLGNFFDYGNIYINGIGGNKLAMYMISDPFSVRQKIIETLNNKAEAAL